MMVQPRLPGQGRGSWVARAGKRLLCSWLVELGSLGAQHCIPQPRHDAPPLPLSLTIQESRPEVDTPTRVCIKRNTTGGCRRGSRCRWLHVSYSTSEVVPSRGSVSASDGTNPLEGIIDAMRQYLASLFSIAPGVLLLLAAKDKKWQHRLAKRTYLVYIIMSFLSVRRASPPVQIRARLCVIVEGKRSAIVNHRAEPSRWPNCVSNLFGSSRAGEFQPVKTF